MIIVAHEILPCQLAERVRTAEFDASDSRQDRQTWPLRFALKVLTLRQAVVLHGGSFLASCHDPFNQPWPTIGFTEWANLDANGAAVCFYKIGNALIEVDVPFFFTAHELFFGGNCIRRAIDYTTLAMEANIIDADVDGRVGGKRQIGGHCTQPEVGAKFLADH